MKVRVTLTVEVDPEAWEATYGIEDLRDDVRSYVLNHVQGSAAADEGAITDVRLRD